MNKATTAAQTADQATQMAKQNTDALNNLRQTVSNLDDYRMQKEVTIPFKFDKYALDPDMNLDMTGNADLYYSSVGISRAFSVLLPIYTVVYWNDIK